MGPAGAVGPTGPTGIVTTSSLVGPIASIAGGSAAFVFTGSTATPIASVYTVGLCVRKTGANALSVNDWVNGYIQVTN